MGLFACVSACRSCRQADRPTEGAGGKGTHTHTDSQADRWPGRQADTQTDRQTHADIETEQTDKQAD